MTTNDNSSKRARAILFALFLVCGLLIYLFGSNWTGTFPTNRSLAYKAGLPLLFLVAAAGLARSERGRPYWRIAFALFIGSLAVLLTRLAGNWLAALFPGEGDTTMQTLATESSPRRPWSSSRSSCSPNSREMPRDRSFCKRATSGGGSGSGWRGLVPLPSPLP